MANNNSPGYLTYSALNNPTEYLTAPPVVELPDSSNLRVSALLSVNSRLSFCIEAICSCSTGFDAKGIQADLQAITQYLEQVLSKRNSDVEENALLGEIGIQTALLSKLIVEREILESEEERFDNNNEVIMVTKADSNSVSLYKISKPNPEPSNPNSSRRLSKLLLSILELWYASNKSHPYLDDDSISFLRKESGLLETQVRNWYVVCISISTRRFY